MWRKGREEGSWQDRLVIASNYSNNGTGEPPTSHRNLSHDEYHSFEITAIAA